MPAAETPAPALFSVGYERRDLAELIGLLRDHRVSVLLDVRLNAIWRKPAFSSTRLAAALADAGIVYRHARSLGNPNDNREPFRSADPRPGGAAFEEGAGRRRCRHRARAAGRAAPAPAAALPASPSGDVR